MTIGLIVALPAESRTLTRRAVKPGACFFVPGAIVRVSGMGGERAHAAAQHLLRQGVTGLLSWGCAGGLSDALQAGDLVLPERVLGDDGACAMLCDNHWRQHAQTVLRAAALPLHTGDVCQAAQVLSNASAKRQLGARCGAIAVDMESLAVARVAQEAGVPFLAVRAIADPVDLTFPAAVQKSLRDDGQYSVPVLLWHLLRAPSQIPELMRLMRCFGHAQANLRRAANSLESLLIF